MSRTSPIEELRKEHQVALSSIEEVQSSVRAGGTGPQTSWAELHRTVRDNLEMFHRGMLLHFRREEEGLFPDVRRMVTERAPRADMLRQFFAEEAEDDFGAHAVLSQRTEEMLASLDEIGRAGASEQQPLGRLRALIDLTRSLLQRHADKEDKLIFPMIERLLDSDQMEEVRERMAALGSASDLIGPAPPGDEELKGLGGQDE